MVPKLRFKEFCGEWEEFVLKDVVDLRREKYNPQKSDKNFKCIELEHLSQETGEIIGSISSLNQKSIKNKFYKDDILYGKLRPYLRKYAYCTFEGVCSSEIWVLNSTTLNNRLLFYYIQTDEFQSVANISSGTKMPRADWNKLKLKKIKVPSLSEQIKIADFLSTVDDKIQNQEDKITHLENIKKGFMKKIFSRKIRFKDDGEEEFPEWEEKKLRDIADVRDGTHDSPKYIKDGYPFITSKNLTEDGKIDFSEISYISENDYKKINERSKVEIGDILFGMIGTIGKPVLVDKEGFAIKNVALIKKSEILLNNYLIQYLQTDYIKKQFLLEQAGGTQKFIALSVIRRLKIYLPCLKEQQKIADFLSSFDKKISTEKDILEYLKEIKKGLLQQMFV